MNYLMCVQNGAHARKKTRDDTGVADVWQFLFNLRCPRQSSGRLDKFRLWLNHGAAMPQARALTADCPNGS